MDFSENCKSVFISTKIRKFELDREKSCFIVYDDNLIDCRIKKACRLIIPNKISLPTINKWGLSKDRIALWSYLLWISFFMKLNELLEESKEKEMKQKVSVKLFRRKSVLIIGEDTLGTRK